MKSIKDVLGMGATTLISGISAYFQQVDILSLIQVAISILCGVLTLTLAVVKIVKLGKNGSLEVDDIKQLSDEAKEEIEKLHQTIDEIKQKGDHDEFI